MPAIPVLDLFAGPGGLGEGFASAHSQGRPRFRLCLSIECDEYAHQTLTLRAFCREFTGRGRPLPSEYLEHMRGAMSRQDLFAAFPAQAQDATTEACLARLGDKSGDRVITERVAALRRRGIDLRNCVMIGGPPCQAYSLVGRSRLSRAKAKGEYKEENDGRHVLYKQYLRLLEELEPAIFVMENVRGILSSSYEGRPIFGQILEDLGSAGYDLHALGSSAEGSLFVNLGDARDYLLVADQFGVPQRRARVFVVGTRSDLCVHKISLPQPSASDGRMTVRDAIADLPALRSGLSSDDSADNWKDWIRRAAGRLHRELPASMSDIAHVLGRVVSGSARLPTRRAALASGSRLGFMANHETRSHIQEDLERYLFYAAWGHARGASPTLVNLPRRLLPNHSNVLKAASAKQLSEVAFADRFRVQVYDEPSTTITSHISKDGHYFIHPDPKQCRSLTVREAARLQTFPDDYLFCGPRTEQYRQVGNAVPPLLARKIALAIQALGIW
jgi:DNA (cytosine-5)-methyltransferase 1